jgi:hypothetical protein
MSLGSQAPLMETLYREIRSVSRAFFYLSLKVPGKGAPTPPLQVAPTELQWRAMPVSRSFVYISLHDHSEGALQIKKKSLV